MHPSNHHCTAVTPAREIYVRIGRQFVNVGGRMVHYPCCALQETIVIHQKPCQWLSHVQHYVYSISLMLYVFYLCHVFYFVDIFKTLSNYRAYIDNSSEKHV